jgi:hypothetical protein
MNVKVCNIDEIVGMLDYTSVKSNIKYKIGFDIHGVLTRYPFIFSFLTRQLIKQGHEVHIVTGSKQTNPVMEKLKSYGIQWTNFFSIVDYHASIGSEVKYDENGPWIDEHEWNRTKGDYAERCRLNWHIDDSEVYNQYFPSCTTYILLK